MTADDARSLLSLGDQHACRRISDALVGSLAGPDESASIGPAVARIWVDIESALSPILGKRGTAALYNRSLHLSGSAHGWLEALQSGPLAEIDFEALETAFAGQAHPETIAAAGEMLQTFCNLLVGLIGVALTERLLRPVVLRIRAGSPSKAP